MKNALSEPQTIVVLGGNSEIGRAIASELTGPATKQVVLAVRQPDSVDTSFISGPDVTAVAFDAADTGAHQKFAKDLAGRFGDIDIVIVAFGVLGDQTDFDGDPQAAAEAVHVNYTGAVSSGLAFANVLKAQGHGHLAIVSSVAGERARASNFVYGSSKAGLDAFAQGLGDSLDGTGVKVTVIRPGFVHSKMTAGMESAPFATTPGIVGELAADGIRKGRHTVWAPSILRYVFSALRHVPRPLFKRLPL